MSNLILKNSIVDKVAAFLEVTREAALRMLRSTNRYQLQSDETTYMEVGDVGDANASISRSVHYVVINPSTWNPAAFTYAELDGATSAASIFVASPAFAARILCTSGAHVGIWVATSTTAASADADFAIVEGSTVRCIRSAGAPVYRQTATTGAATPVFVSTPVAGVSIAAEGTSPVIGSLTTYAAPASVFWRSVCYGKGLFVAIGYLPGGAPGNLIMTSPDGITWTGRASPIQGDWTSVCYGNGRFVAVSDSVPGLDPSLIHVAWSDNGIDWALANTPTAHLWIGLAYGDGVFVAAANDIAAPLGETLITSDNGIDWTARTVPNHVACYAVGYGNGRFVAADLSGGTTWNTSVDRGRNWTSITVPQAGSWWGIAYGNGTWVTVRNQSGQSNNVMTSKDGVNWTLGAIGVLGGWVSVVFGGGLFVAISVAGKLVSSPDGVTWTEHVGLPANEWEAVGYGNGKFVGLAKTGSNNRIMLAGLATPSANVQSGSVQLNGATPVSVACSAITASNFVGLTLTTVAGTQGPVPSVQTVAGTGFTVAGTAGDTSTYSYRVF